MKPHIDPGLQDELHQAAHLVASGAWAIPVAINVHSLLVAPPRNAKARHSIHPTDQRPHTERGKADL